MGIRNLNNFLKNKCSRSIQKITLAEISNRCIVVDISIYLYQFEVDGKLEVNMNKLIDIMCKYSIKPIFVFDGKPPCEKTQTIETRKEARKKASQECEEINNMLSDDNISEEEKLLLTEKYKKLKKEAVTLTRDKIKNVKNILNNRGVCFIDPEDQEADKICAEMVVNDLCWACMSDDMDMFIYGCNFIIRDFDMENETAILYNLKEILRELDITYENFKRICVISGTDYNSIEKGSSINLYTAMKLFNRFQKNVKYKNMNFYEWLRVYIKYNIDYDNLEKIYNMFTVESFSKTIKLV
tara:strand:- start:4468 stop:5361 length:894 start_codon:yes stop_codon:yes gene_type:complete